MNNQNKEHHDLNDVCHRLDRLISYSHDLLKVTNALLLVSGHELDLLASIDKHVASIDENTPPPSDEDIEADKVTAIPTQKEPTS